MESAETEHLEYDPHPSSTVDAQADDKENHVLTVATSETEALEVDAHPASAADSTGPRAGGSKADGDCSASIQTELLDLEHNTRADITGDAQAGGNDQNSSGERSEEVYTYASASVSTVGLQAGERKHDETATVSAEGAVSFRAVDVGAGGNECDVSVMAAAASEAIGCVTADFGVSEEECSTDIALEARNMQEKTTVPILENNEVSFTPMNHLELEVVNVTQSPNTISNHEESFSSASPAGETEGDDTDHIPIHNQEEIQGEEPVFDISEFDLSAHDVPITETFFDEHCMFPALDADKAETWQGSEDNIILMETSGEHGSDQRSNMDAVSVRTSSDTIANHGSADMVVDEEKLVHQAPLPTSLESNPIDVTRGHSESRGRNDTADTQGHEQVGGHQFNEADGEHCMFPALDADKAETWHGSEDNIILMESSGEHDTNHRSNIDAVPLRTSSDTIANHGSADMEVDEEKLGHEVPLPTSFESNPIDVTRGHSESRGRNDTDTHGHEQVGGHQFNEADGEHCMFPALDADNAENWQGSEDHIIVMESSGEHDSDQLSNIDAVPARTSSDTIANHGSADMEVDEEKLDHEAPLPTRFESKPIDFTCGHSESSGRNDTDKQGHEQAGGHQFNEAEGLALIIVNGSMLPSEDIEGPDAQETHLEGGAEGSFVTYVEKSPEVAQPQNVSPEDTQNPRSSDEEVENEDNQLNESHRDAAALSVELDPNSPESFTGLGVERNNCVSAADEDLPHTITQDPLVSSTVDTLKSHEEGIRQAFGNEEKQHTSVSSTVGTSESHEEGVIQAFGNEKIEHIDSPLDENSHGKAACEQIEKAEESTLPNEGNSSSLWEGACTAGTAELVCTLASSKQEEKITAAVQTTEISTEAVVRVEEPLVQETLRPNKESTPEKVAENDSESQIDPVVFNTEADKLHYEEAEEQMDDPIKSIQVSDGNVLEGRESDVEDTVKDRDEVSKFKVEGLEAENEDMNEQADSYSKPPGDVEETVDEDRHAVIWDTIVASEQETEESNEQEESGPNSPVDERPFRGSITEEATQDLTAERINILSPSDGRSLEGLDGNMLDSRQADVEEAVEDRGEIVEDKDAGLKQEENELNEQGEPSLQQSVDTRPLQSVIAEEAILTTERANTGSSSDAETATSSCSNFTPANDFLEGPNNDEKHALQSLKSVSEDSKEKRDMSSLAGADSSIKKQLEKQGNNKKSPKLKGGSKFDSNNMQAKEGDDDDSDDGGASDSEEESSEGKVHESFKEGNDFGIGDLIWAKVRSHPWWPAQIFDPADASKSARKAKKLGRVLVAFFGDCTFAWLQQSQMIAFRPHFKEKVKQTTVRIFCIAVEEALQEFCRRSELGLSCSHFKGSLHSTCSFPDANTGIREGVRVKRHKDFGSSVQMFRPDLTLEYVKGVACSPLGKWCSTLKFAELRGHVYGLRTCMVASESFESAPVSSTMDTIPSHGSKLKRPHSSLDTNADVGVSTEVAKKMKDNEASNEKGLSQISKKARKPIAGGQGCNLESKVAARKLEGTKEGNKTIKIKLSKKTKGDGIMSVDGLPDTGPDQRVESEKSSDDGEETLIALVGSPHKPQKRSSSKKDKKISSHEKKGHKRTRKSKIQTNSADSDSEAAALPGTEVNAEDSFAVTSSLSEEKVSKGKVKGRKDKKKAVKAALSPASSIDAKDSLEGTHQTKHSKSLKLWSGDEMEEAKSSKFLKETERMREGLANEMEAGKKEAVRKFSRVGDSIRKVAGELTGPVIGKSFDDSLIRRPGGTTIKMKLPISPTSGKAASKESAEDVDLLQLRQDLELLTHKTGGGSRKAGKNVRKRDQADALAGKASPQWQNVPHKTQKSGVQELALAARKRKSEIVHDEVSDKLPKKRSTTGPQGDYASKAYVKGMEKPTDLRTVDKSVSYYSGRPALLASNMKGGSSQRYDEKLSSHMPLGLFMRFPEDFPLPSESQLKATFIPFGPLQMTSTRLYHDSASAQVVFKHGRDAESAMRHAKKNPVFGPVAVTYRLRHLSHSLKTESKSDTSSPNNISTPSPVVRRSYVTKEKDAGSSAAIATRTGDKELGTSCLLTSSNNRSEPTGDIQDQMMTLLRQVSVLVKPSPVGSDGT